MPRSSSSAGANREDDRDVLPKDILVPTDLGEGADEALAYACELAQQFGATVHLLNVIGVPALGVPELGVALTSSMIDSIVRDHQFAIERLAEIHRSQVSIGVVLLCIGDARELINRTAVDVHADLIVMGTHGRRGVSRALFGSVAEAVVRTAPCPVLTVRAHTTVRHGRDEIAA
jgi:nucleotide-binding universal stress UspA family protein